MFCSIRYIFDRTDFFTVGEKMRNVLFSVMFTVNAFFVTFSYIAQETRNDNPIDGNVYFGRTNESMYNPGDFPHGGPGQVALLELTPREKFQSQFLFLHRGRLYPKSGLGEHVHRWMEEMYFVLDNHTAQFRVNDRTAELPGPCMALCPMGDSHGIYNDSDEIGEFMNLGVALRNHQYDAVNLAEKNDLVNEPIDSPPPFLWSLIDKRLCHPRENFMGGEGEIPYRTIWDDYDFRTNWMFVNHYVIPPDATIGYHRHDYIEEVYFILSGKGRMTINGITKDIKKDDVGTCVLHSAHGVWNNSDEDLEIISIAVAMEKGKIAHTELELEMRGR
jgi:mannose-6-phosphate isomerase-like protein (cupin superfamily)